MTVLLIILRVLLAFVFIYAAVGKVQSQPGVQTMYDQWLTPGSMGHWAFVAFEFALALWLLSGLTPRAAAGMSLMVLAVFTLLIAVELQKREPKSCGCLGGGSVVEVTPQDVRAELRASIARNVALMAVAGWLALIGSSRPSRGEVVVANSDA